MKEFFKNNWKHIVAYVLVFCLGIGLCAVVGTAGKSKAVNSYVDEAPAMENLVVKTKGYDGAMPEEQVEMGASAVTESASGSSKFSYTTNRKLVRNASISLDTEKYAEVLKGIDTRVSKLGGYIENSNESTYNQFAYTTLVVRVPSEKLDEFLNYAGEIATITSKQISTDDITSSYVDTESHLAALRTEQETLMGLLEKAESLSDVITVQDRLTAVRSQIEYYQSMMNTYDNEIEYSTINITISEVGKETPTGEGYFAKIWIGLKKSFYNIGEGFKSIVSFVIVNIPYLLILGLVVLVLYVIIKKVKSKKKSGSVKEDTFTE